MIVNDLLKFEIPKTIIWLWSREEEGSRILRMPIDLVLPPMVKYDKFLVS